MNPPAGGGRRWDGVGYDLAAFAIGLSLAYWFHWETTDLVWSLWLSSLVVGYTLILWILSGPLRELCQGIAADRSDTAGLVAKVATVGLFFLGTLLGVAFFTVHFGGFHFGHSIFLAMFFPISESGPRGWPDLAMYREIFARYWVFLPAAFLAERHLFGSSPRQADTSVTPLAIARRKSVKNGMSLPYRGVIRMHLLIFFFFAANFLRLDGFLVYTVIYAVYFFPWRLLKREKPVPAAAIAG